MKFYKNTRLIIPAIIFLMGVFNLLNPSLDPAITKFWWILTPFALLVGLIRLYLFSRQKKTETGEP